MKIVWTYRAVQNRDAQLDYIGQESPEAAIRLDLAIDNQVRQLKDFPELGRLGRVEGTRELVIDHTSFVVVYGDPRRRDFHSAFAAWRADVPLTPH